MSCFKEERPFVYMIWLKGTGGDDGPVEPGKILVAQAARLGRSTEEVEQAVRDEFFKNPMNNNVDGARLAVAAKPF